MQSRLREDTSHRLREMIASLLEARSCVKIDHLPFSATPNLLHV